VPYYPTRKLTILAMDPSVKDGNKVLRTQIEIPNEALNAGPKEYRVHLIDFDSTTDVLYPAAKIHAGVNRDNKPPGGSVGACAGQEDPEEFGVSRVDDLRGHYEDAGAQV
jgi:hypothetical protein